MRSGRLLPFFGAMLLVTLVLGIAAAFPSPRPPVAHAEEAPGTPTEPSARRPTETFRGILRFAPERIEADLARYLAENPDREVAGITAMVGGGGFTFGYLVVTRERQRCACPAPQPAP